MHGVNAVFEFLGALLAWRSVLELRRAGGASGVYTPQFLFSALWALECVPYYLSHADYGSATFAAVRCVALAAWWLRS